MAVLGVEEIGSVAYAGGRAFGPAGPATMRRLLVSHAVDPGAGGNPAIVDLELAERGPDGLVHFDHDVVIIQPADPAARNGWALVDVPNRGGPTISSFLQNDNTPFFPQPSEPPPGDGHLLAQGWTLVHCGWQFDIAQPSLLGLRAPAARQSDGTDITGPVSYTFQAAARADRLPLVLPGHRLWPAVAGTAELYENGEALPSGSWRFSPSGSGLLRDGGFEAGAVYRCTYETTGAVVSGCGLLALRDIVPWLRAEGVATRAALFGVSQSGRVIRQFLHDGMNVDEAGRPVYDGVMPLIAGGRLGQFNRRFAIPGSLPSGPDEVPADPTYGALLARAGAPLKVMAMNSSNEYWRGDGGLVFPEGHPADHPDVRVHLVAGTQHSTGYLPQLFEMPALGWKGRHGFNVVDYRPVLRALLAQLVAWVEGRAEPTPSTAPTGGLLSTREAVLAQFAAAGVATPRLGSFVQPAGPVPAVDQAGNEVGGIRLPDVAAPVGVHAGWNLRHPDMGAPTDELFLVGSSWWLPANDLPTLDDHLARSAAVADDLVARRLLLATDRDAVLARATKAWHAATTPTPAPTPT